MSKKEETVKVCVRCRPLNSKEQSDGRQKIVNMDTRAGSVTLIAPGTERNSGEPPKNFTFDHTFDEAFTQEAIYQQTAHRIVESVLEGFNGTIFAYGQTGSGKTHSMMGVAKDPGVIPRCAIDIFERATALLESLGEGFMTSLVGVEPPLTAPF